MMSEVDGKSGGGSVPKRRDLGLMERALHERWEIPDAVRGPLMKRLSVIVQDPSSAPREVLAAAGVLLAASKINLAHIATSINAERHEELEQRMTEIEQLNAARDQQGGAGGSFSN
jgi:predicted RND superfamily exporter protein